jgi:DNA-directed RNA polymerase I subunit RPA12
MALVGTLLFCTACGDLLDRAAPAVRKIACRRCRAWNTSNVPSPLRSSRNHGNRLTNSREDRWPPSSRTVSKVDAFPSALRAKQGFVRALDHSGVETWATTSEACPKCGGNVTLFREMQLRGLTKVRRFFSGVEGVRISMSMLCCVSGLRGLRALTRYRWKLDN